MLTDAEDHLELLRDNVRRNNLGERVSVQLFDWKDETSWDLSSAPDLILCTDNAYHPSLYEPLAAALERCLAGGAKGLFGVTKTDTSFAFFELLTARGLDYRFAEAPADDYYALLAICKAPAFDGRRRRGGRCVCLFCCCFKATHTHKNQENSSSSRSAAHSSSSSAAGSGDRARFRDPLTTGC